MVKNTRIIIPIVLLVLGLGAGFFGGYEYRNYALRRSIQNFGNGTGAQRFIGNRNGQNVAGARGSEVSGTILSMDSNSITVKLPNGSTKIVLYSSNTTYSNTVSATQSDLKVGEGVAVFGTNNSDGSVTATNIQINPMFQGQEPSPTP
jgi:hypothetical protein